MKNIMSFIAPLLMAFLLLQSCTNKTKVSVKNDDDDSMVHEVDKGSNDMGKMDNSMMESMKMTMSKMKGMTMTGDFDLDFANMMIMHHQAAIDMSEVELAKGSDAQIKTMAQKIITAQKAEIAQLQQFASQHKMTEAKMEHGEKHNELGETMNRMEVKMLAMQMSGNTDMDFVMMMIPHHESAIAMAQNEIEHGKEFELKKLAQKIITDQTKEINDFKAWLATL